MKTFLVSLVSVLLATSQSYARTFFRSEFTTSARYEDMEGHKYASEIKGTVRISNDAKFCAIDLQNLGFTAECVVALNDYENNMYGIAFSGDTARKISHSLIEKDGWPKDVLTRTDQLLKQLYSIRLGYMKDGAFYNFIEYQLDDNEKADALHVFYNQGYEWQSY